MKKIIIIMVMMMTTLMLIQQVVAQSTEEVTYGQTWANTCENSKCSQSSSRNYWNEDGFEPINVNIVPTKSEPLYSYGVEKGIYSVFFKSDLTTAESVKFYYDENKMIGKNPHKSGYVTFQPMSMNYRNDLDQIQQINTIQASTPDINENEYYYPEAFGPGLDITYTYYFNQLKKFITIDEAAVLPPPAKYIIDGGNPTIDVDFVITWNDEIDIYLDDEIWDKKKSKETIKDVEFKLNGETLFSLFQPEANDDEGNAIPLRYEFNKKGNKLYVVIKTDYAWITDEKRIFPVFIDPSAGPTDPGLGESRSGVGSIAWTNPSRVTSNDGSMATASVSSGDTTRYLFASQYGFDLPDSTTSVDGIELQINRRSSGASSAEVWDNRVRLVKNDSVQSHDKSLGTEWGFAETTITYGSSSDTWSTSWGVSEIEHADFGSVLAVNGGGTNSRTASVDWMGITVYYTVAPPSYSGNGSNTTTPDNNDYVLLFTNWSSGLGVSAGWFGTNFSGTWVNTTPETGDDNASVNFTTSVQVTAGTGKSVCWASYANDTIDTIGSTDTYCMNINSAYWVNITDPTTGSPLDANASNNITVTYLYYKDGSNLTSNVQATNITIGGEMCTLLQDEMCIGTPDVCSSKSTEATCEFIGCTWAAGDAFSARTGTSATSSSGIDTVTFTTMGGTDFVALSTALTDTDDVYSDKWTGKTATTASYWMEDDTGGNELTNYQYAVIARGHGTVDGNEYECGTESDSSSTHTISFSETFPDTGYALICNPGTDTDSPTCILKDSTNPKTTSGFGVFLNDDAGSSETVASVDWCAFEYGDYTTGDMVIKAGSDSVTNGAVSIDFTDEGMTDYVDTSYVVMLTDITSYSADGCTCEVSGRTTTGFTALCSDDGGSHFNCDDTFDWVTFTEIDADVVASACETDGNESACSVYAQSETCTNSTGCGWDNVSQEAWVPNVGWQVNCTVGGSCSAAHDLFLESNYTTDSVLSDDTQTSAVDCGTAEDISFTISYPSSMCSENDGCTTGGCSACTYCSVNFDNPDQIDQNCTGQTASDGFYLFTNTGDVNIDITWLLNESFDSTLSSEYDTDNDPAGSTAIADPPTVLTIVSALASSGTEEIWQWGTVTSGLAGNYNYAINSSSVSS